MTLLRPRRVLHALGLLLVALVLAACQVDADVVLTMRDDGSGAVSVTVALDPEAAARVPDLADELAVDDLEFAGWEVEGPETVDGGGVEIRASKPFATPEEGAAVLAELTGPDGVLTDIELTSDRSFGRTTYSFEAAADPSGGVAALADDQLIEVLGGNGFGGQLEQIEADTGKPADEQVTLALTVRLPGTSETWELEPGGEATQLDLEHTETRPLTLALVAAAALCLLLGIVLLVVRTVRAVRRRRARRRGEPETGATIAESAGVAVPGAVTADDVAWADAHDADSGMPRSRTAATAAAAARSSVGDEEPSPGGRRLELVVLDLTGVVFDGADRAEDLLAQFAKDRGSGRSSDEVRESYRLASEGRLTVGELWASVGLVGDPGHLSDEFLAVFRLRAGSREFLERMLARDLPVAGVANDVAEWSRKLRATYKLEHLTKAWIVSGDVGERLPGGAILGRVIQATGIEARNALLISDRLEHLDAARSFGFAGVWFVPEGTELPDPPPYPVVHTFAELGISG